MNSSASARIRAGVVALGIAATLALGGCTASGSPADVEGDSASTGASVEGLHSLVADIAFDYDDVQSNDELAQLSDAVFSGRVVRIKNGPQYGKGGDGLTEIRSVVVEVQVTDVVKGSVDRGRSAHVVIYAPVGVDAARWRSELPEGTRVIVYATESGADDRPGNGLDTIDASAGRPAGAPLYVPAVQGFTVELPDGTLYWPLTDVVRKDDLAAALPGGDAVGNLLPGEK